MFEIHYRTAELADVPTLARLPRPGEAGGDPPERMARYLAGEHHPQQALPPRVMWMASHGGSPIGYAAGHLTHRFGCDGELQWIYVVPEHRRARIGSTLLRLVAEWFVERRALRVCVDVGDEGARPFYTRAGAVRLNEHWMVWNDISDVLTATPDRDDVYRLRTPTSDAEWAAYHAIRRTVPFERRGKLDEYDPSHPDELRPGNHPLLLLYRGEPVGTIRVDMTPDEAIFRRVAVREDVQRRGHGRQMLVLAERFVRAQGKTRISSHVDPAAVGFYERCGFARERSDPKGATVVMTKMLERLPDAPC